MENLLSLAMIIVFNESLHNNTNCEDVYKVIGDQQVYYEIYT